MDSSPVLSPSDFVAVLNQTLEYAYPSVAIVGELANFRVSKGRWVYFDLKDDTASVKFFGSVYNLPGPLEEGMMVRVVGRPRLSELYGFSVSFSLITPVGEGSLRRAADMLKVKLAAEGLFEESRKRPVSYPPQRIGLVASRQSAAYQDFIKILGQRWGGIEINVIDVQVQGDAAPGQVVGALKYFNAHTSVDVVVITRGGGSADDLATFNTEQVTRAVAASRIPTVVAIGHEVDVSLAELAADVRASTPSNAAELLTPDRAQVLLQLTHDERQLSQLLRRSLDIRRREMVAARRALQTFLAQAYSRAGSELRAARQLLEALSPNNALKRGYAVVRSSGEVIYSSESLSAGSVLDVTLRDGNVKARVQ